MWCAQYKPCLQWFNIIKIWTVYNSKEKKTEWNDLKHIKLTTFETSWCSKTVKKVFFLPLFMRDNSIIRSQCGIDCIYVCAINFEASKSSFFHRTRKKKVSISVILSYRNRKLISRTVFLLSLSSDHSPIQADERRAHIFGDSYTKMIAFFLRFFFYFQKMRTKKMDNFKWEEYRLKNENPCQWHLLAASYHVIPRSMHFITIVNW